MAILSSPWQYIASTPPATKVYSFLILALSAIHFALLFVVPHDDGRPFTPWLTVIPGTSFWYPWSFFTASFVETSVIEVSTSAHHRHPSCSCLASSFSPFYSSLPPSDTSSAFGERRRPSNLLLCPALSQISLLSSSIGSNS